MLNCRSPAMSAMSFVSAITVANTVTKAVMNLQSCGRVCSVHNACVKPQTSRWAGRRYHSKARLLSSALQNAQAPAAAAKRWPCCEVCAGPASSCRPVLKLLLTPSALLKTWPSQQNNT